MLLHNLKKAILLFTFYKQLNAMDCGPTCLRMVAKHYGRHYNREGIAESTGISKQGVSLLGISEAAEKIGFEAQGVQLTFEELRLHATLPCILHWDQNHFVVLTAVKNSNIKVADPAKGMVTYSKEEFLQRWITTSDNGEHLGIALLLNPTSAFFEREGEKETKLDWKRIGSYFRKVRWKVVQVLIALLVTSLLQLMLPFLTQNMVDKGINTRNLPFVTVILVAQLVLVFSRTIADFIRSRLLLYISTIVNLAILSDFWVKLTKLPLSYFDNHRTGEILQRIGDNKQIENFLMGNALNTLFSLFNFVIYAVVLALYDASVFAVFITGNVLYFSWIQFFLRIRRKINYQTFYISAKENNATLQLVQGMQELRLNNAEQLKRREWENIQTGIFQLNFKSLTYSQYQQSGSLLITHGKDLLITFLVAGLVIDGKLTFGAMLAIQYIIGQLNSPVEQFAGFVQTAQDAKISLERLNEVHHLKEEESQITQYIQQLPESKCISFHNLSFTYPGAGNDPVLKNIDVEIPEGKVTAIVGASGSGKTTLLKLLLKFYDFYEGEISIGKTGFKNISPSYWRSQCGAVMQDGYIFNDTIARNIAPGDEEPDPAKLRQCCETAKILSFIESLPNGFNTQLGAEGVGISQGQKQRLLIARAIYKDPQYLFFDEATNSLDSNNEKAIVENLQKFFTGRTVIIVAHRLSTVKNADNIIVLNNGEIEEQGSHAQLSAMKGKYYELVKNQLELGN